MTSEMKGAANQLKITAIKALELKSGRTLVRVETDAGIHGYGPCHGVTGIHAGFSHSTFGSIDQQSLGHIKV